ncbi:sugar ABC transporter permease, partial [Butyricicoccus sp. 1XD8-22]
MVQSKKQRYLFLSYCLLPTFIVFCIFTVYPM